MFFQFSQQWFKNIYLKISHRFNFNVIKEEKCMPYLLILFNHGIVPWFNIVCDFLVLLFLSLHYNVCVLYYFINNNLSETDMGQTSVNYDINLLTTELKIHHLTVCFLTAFIG